MTRVQQCLEELVDLMVDEEMTELVDEEMAEEKEGRFSGCQSISAAPQRCETFYRPVSNHYSIKCVDIAL